MDSINWDSLLGGAKVSVVKEFVVGDADFNDLRESCTTVIAEKEVNRLRRRGRVKARDAARKALVRRGLHGSSR